jgi:hypothetical protein
MAGPQPPIEAIREAVRAEVAGIAHAAQQVALHAAAQAVAGAHVAAGSKVFGAIAALLAVRLLLLLALLGGFVIAVMALREGTYQADGVLAGYACLFILPLVWLERNPRVAKPEA